MQKIKSELRRRVLFRESQLKTSVANKARDNHVATGTSGAGYGTQVYGQGKWGLLRWLPRMWSPPEKHSRGSPPPRFRPLSIYIYIHISFSFSLSPYIPPPLYTPAPPNTPVNASYKSHEPTRLARRAFLPPACHSGSSKKTHKSGFRV